MSRKVTTKLFKERLLKAQGNDYVLLNEYTGHHSRLKIYHKKCGQVWTTDPYKAIHKWCPTCFNPLRAKLDDVKQRVRDQTGDEYVVLSTEYKNARTKLLFYHRECSGDGYFKTTPDSFLNKKTRCPYEKGKSISEAKTLDSSVFLKELRDKFKNNFSILGEYVNKDTPIDFKCNTCGFIWNVTPANILKSTGCKKCNQNYIRTKEDFENELFSRTNGNYQLIGDYKNTQNKVKLKHKCGYILNITPNKFLNCNQQCPECHGHFYRTASEFKSDLYDLVGDEYVAVSDFTKMRDKITMKHNICGTIWEVRPYAFFEGGRCPNCKQSRGELEVKEYLDCHNIYYIWQKRFDGCKYKNTLPFDFYLPGTNTCIEYDGEQHYKPIPYYGGEEGFKLRVLRDNIKTKYCIDSGKQLIRIRYGENTEEILNKKLLKAAV